MENKVTGKALLKLDEISLKEMGVTKKGDVLCILDSI